MDATTPAEDIFKIVHSIADCPIPIPMRFGRRSNIQPHHSLKSQDNSKHHGQQNS